jgi:hypothetical protein
MPSEIPILWPRAVMVGPRPRVLLTLPLVMRHIACWRQLDWLVLTDESRKVQQDGKGNCGECLDVELRKDRVKVGSFIKIIIIKKNLLTCLVIPRRRVLLEKPTGSQLVKKLPAFYGTRRFVTTFTGAHPHSQVLTTCPYPEPARSSPYPHIPLPEDPS